MAFTTEARSTGGLKSSGQHLHQSRHLSSSVCNGLLRSNDDASSDAVRIGPTRVRCRRRLTSFVFVRLPLPVSGLCQARQCTRSSSSRRRERWVLVLLLLHLLHDRRTGARYSLRCSDHSMTTPCQGT